ncbi:carboxylesterase/lipase family protein [Embleya scabrispora]|uniref:carboxylesterase/lipase family protein n=1 Tax=Embleya scabrispora TaxID=159449 RepID=UPI00035E874E|nr:carboxylesterase family protein [Embleya scabrispora]MYS82673.1 carboxylesterase family protein [Streptomyces sp. SID5474]
MPQQPLVTTNLGPVQGFWEGRSARFLGIPYAKPPVGDLRFAAPEAPEAWTEPLMATAYGPTAQRRAFGDGPTIIPEPSIPGDDVLGVNVFTPDPSPDAALPVLVWIHGGGFVAGSPASPWYDGTAFNRDGVVLVSLGYRLGIEGFLHLEGAPDNRGVLDWIAALRWVRDNIAAFGGDPAKVTIAGQSAGGGAVQTLMVAPSAHDLFRAAISVSGAVMEPQSRADGLAVAELFTSRTGLPATAAALRDLSHDELLRLQDLLTAPDEGAAALPGLLLAPFSDGELIPEDVHTAFRDGSATPAPLMLGATHHEFNAVAEFEMSDAPIEVAVAILGSAGLPPEGVEAYLALHDGAAPAQVIGQAITDTLFRGTAVSIAEARAGQDRPTWLYAFEWLSTSPTFGGKAFHCLDLPFAFDLLAAENAKNATGPDAPQKLADAMHGAWVAFIRDLDPGAQWPRYTRTHRDTMVWDATPRVTPDVLSAERKIWTARRTPTG